MESVNSVSTKGTFDASDTAVIASCERSNSIRASDTGTSAQTKFCSVIGSIREISFFLNVVSFPKVMRLLYQNQSVIKARKRILVLINKKIKRKEKHLTAKDKVLSGSI